MTERVVLDVLDAEEAVVCEGEGRRADEAEEVDDEDAQLVLVLAALEGVLADDEGTVEVRAVVCVIERVRGRGKAKGRGKTGTDARGGRRSRAPGTPGAQSRRRAAARSAGGPCLRTHRPTLSETILRGTAKKRESESAPRGSASKYRRPNSSAASFSPSTVA